MKLLKEYKNFEYEILKEETEGQKGKLFLKGIIQRADALNANGRIYPRDILFREIENYRRLVGDRRAIGCLDHDDSATVDLKNVSHIITDVWTEGDTVYGKVEILPTPMGEIARGLIESNVKIGISSRALGTVRNNGSADVVQNDLHMICWDLVSDPSTHNAFMMKESKEYDPSIIKHIFSKEDRVYRALNDILSITKPNK
jgi:hypothetical protein